MHSSENGLTPSYHAAPEIQQSQNHQYQHQHLYEPSQVNYGTLETSYTDAPLFKNAEEIGLQDDQESSLNTFATAVGTIFRSVLAVLFFIAFVAVGISFYQAYTDSRPGKPWPAHPPSRPEPQPHGTIEERVKDILQSTPLIDGHDDFAIFIRGAYNNSINTDHFKNDFENGHMQADVDLPRLRAGMNGGAFWSAWVACPVNASYDMTDANYALEVSHSMEQIDLLKRLQEQYSEHFTSPIGQRGSGREQMLERWHLYKSFFGPISIEGLHQVFPSSPMSMLREYYALGVRMATLTWNCHNAFADAAIVMNSITEPQKVVNGIFRKEGAVTKRGRAVLREMNRIGMIIDVSHTSYWTQKAVLGGIDGETITRAPVVFSHSSAYSLCPHPRNVRDEILDLVPETRSLVMVNFSPNFISCKAVVNGTEGSEPYFVLPELYEKNNTLHQVARHIKYIGDRIGYEYVGLGSDFDGMGELTPKGLDGVDKFPDLVAELLRMGIRDENVKGIVGGNLLRAWKEIDDVSVRMQREGILPGLDDSSGY